MFDSIKNVFNGIRRAFGLFDGSPKFSRKELRLDSDEHDVKRKLGKAFFAKRLNPNTRVARIASLNKQEYSLARARGWVR